VPAVGTREFVAKVDAWAAHEPLRLRALAIESIQNMCEHVVIDTPVVTGNLRGGWQPSIGAPSPPIEGRLDPGGGQALADLAVSLANLQIGDVLYFTNGVIYARRVEYGFVGEDSLGRHYNQAGRFYLTNNAVRWQDFVSEAAETLSKGTP
jgi:hypothetical protein